MKTVISLDVLGEMYQNKEHITSILVNTIAEPFLLYRIHMLIMEPKRN